ncbi:hypothetical protein Pelo_10956 [Pelomyxa schiedti]|nr:hypothetical protein Pelo_10956 [Pelomyxa schiedti]
MGQIPDHLTTTADGPAPPSSAFDTLFHHYPQFPAREIPAAGSPYVGQPRKTPYPIVLVARNVDRSKCPELRDHSTINNNHGSPHVSPDRVVPPCICSTTAPVCAPTPQQLAPSSDCDSGVDKQKKKKEGSASCRAVGNHNRRHKHRHKKHHRAESARVSSAELFITPPSSPSDREESSEMSVTQTRRLPHKRKKHTHEEDESLFQPPSSPSVEESDSSEQVISSPESSSDQNGEVPSNNNLPPRSCSSAGEKEEHKQYNELILPSPVHNLGKEKSTADQSTLPEEQRITEKEQQECGILETESSASSPYLRETSELSHAELASQQGNAQSSIESSSEKANESQQDSFEVGAVYSSKRDMIRAGIHGAKTIVYPDTGGAPAVSVIFGSKAVCPQDCGFSISFSPKSGYGNLKSAKKNHTPVRVIRGSLLNNQYSPEKGYRYDGLYYVNNHSDSVWDFTRLEGQSPPPWNLDTCVEPLPRRSRDPDCSSRYMLIKQTRLAHHFTGFAAMNVSEMLYTLQQGLCPFCCHRICPTQTKDAEKHLRYHIKELSSCLSKPALDELAKEKAKRVTHYINTLPCCSSKHPRTTPHGKAPQRAFPPRSEQRHSTTETLTDLPSREHQLSPNFRVLPKLLACGELPQYIAEPSPPTELTQDNPPSDDDYPQQNTPSRGSDLPEFPELNSEDSAHEELCFDADRSDLTQLLRSFLSNTEQDSMKNEEIE